MFRSAMYFASGGLFGSEMSDGVGHRAQLFFNLLSSARLSSLSSSGQMQLASDFHSSSHSLSLASARNNIDAIYLR